MDLHEQFLEWTPDGSQIIFSYGTTMQSIDSQGSRLQTIIDVNPSRSLYYHFHADVSPVTSRIVYTTCRFPSDPPSWRELIDRCCFVSHQPEWIHSPPGWYLANHLYHYEIATSNSYGSWTRRLTENFLLDHYPVWSPDESRIAFISHPTDPFPLYGAGAPLHDGPGWNRRPPAHAHPGQCRPVPPGVVAGRPVRCIYRD